MVEREEQKDNRSPDSKPSRPSIPQHEADRPDRTDQRSEGANHLVHTDAQPPQPDNRQQANQAIRENTNIVTPTNQAQHVSVEGHDGQSYSMTRTKAPDGRTDLYSHAGADGKEQFFKQEGSRLVQVERNGTPVANGDSLNVRKIQVGREFAEREPNVGTPGSKRPGEQVAGAADAPGMRRTEAAKSPAESPPQGKPNSNFQNSPDKGGVPESGVARQTQPQHGDGRAGQATDAARSTQDASRLDSRFGEQPKGAGVVPLKDNASRFQAPADTRADRAVHEAAHSQQREPGAANPSQHSNAADFFNRAKESVNAQEKAPRAQDKPNLQQQHDKEGQQAHTSLDQRDNANKSGQLPDWPQGSLETRRHDHHNASSDTSDGAQHQGDKRKGAGTDAPQTPADRKQAVEGKIPGYEAQKEQPAGAQHPGGTGHRGEVLDQVPGKDPWGSHGDRLPGDKHHDDKPHAEKPGLIPVPIPIGKDGSFGIGGGGGGGKGPRIEASDPKGGKDGKSHGNRGDRDGKSPERGDKDGKSQGERADGKPHGDRGDKQGDRTSKGERSPGERGERSPGERGDRSPDDRRGDRPDRGDRIPTGRGASGGGGSGAGDSAGLHPDRAGAYPGDRGSKGDGVSGGRGGRPDIAINAGADGKPHRSVDSKLLDLLADPKLQSKMLDTLQTVASNKDAVRNPRVRELFGELNDRQIWQMQMGLLDGVKNPVAFDRLPALLQGKLIQLAEILGGKELATGKLLDSITRRDGKLTPGSETLSTVLRGIDRTARMFETDKRSSRQLLSEMLVRTIDLTNTNRGFSVRLDQPTKTVLIIEVLQQNVLKVADQRKEAGKSELPQRSDPLLQATEQPFFSFQAKGSKVNETRSAATSNDWEDEAETSDWTDTRAEKYAKDLLSKAGSENEDAAILWMNEKDTDQWADDADTSDWTASRAEKYANELVAKIKEQAAGDEQLAQVEADDDEDNSVITPELTAEEIAALAKRKLIEEEERRNRQLEQLKQLQERRESERRSQRGSYRIRFGDSLISIAKNKFRDALMAPLIYDLNKRDLPLMRYGQKIVATLKIDQTIALPSQNDVDEYRRNPITHSDVDMSFPAGATASPDKAPASFPSAEAELAARFGLSWTIPPTTALNRKSLFDSENVKGRRTDAVRKKVRDNRHNIEAALGPLKAKPQPVPTEPRIRYLCRIGDTLRSIAQKHPALNDPDLWELLAIVNDLSTDINQKGEPVVKLRRGQQLLLPTPAEIDEWRAPELVAFVLFNQIYIEMNTIDCSVCGRPTLISCVVCPACGSYMPDFTSVSSQQYRGSPAKSFGRSAGVPENNLRVQREDDDEPHTGTAVMKGAASGKPGAVSNSPAANEPRELRPASEHYLTAYARVVEEGSLDDLSIGYRIALDAFTESGWNRLVAYEFTTTSILHQVLDSKGTFKTKRISLPQKQALELAKNDLAKNWQQYYQSYSKKK